MGQKANILTLRQQNSLNFFNVKNKELWYINQIFIHIQELFTQNKVFLTNHSFNVINNNVTIVFYLFFRTNFINNFKKKIVFSKVKKNNNSLKNKKSLIALFHRFFNKSKINIIKISIKNLNKNYDKNFFLSLFIRFKRFHNALFPRRFYFFIDFLKITLLFLYSKISLKFYTEILGRIFEILPKRRHNFFLSFTEQFFNCLVKEIVPKMQNFQHQQSLKGVKLILSGRIQAKPRAKLKYFQIGTIPMQSIEENIEFSKVHIYTMYGVFGLKIWTFKK